MIREVSGKELDELVTAGKRVVCDFFAVWCNPCRMLAPVMEALSEEFGDAEFVKVDVDKNGDLAASLGIFSIPNVFVFADGKAKAHNVGYLSEEDMRTFLLANLS